MSGNMILSAASVETRRLHHSEETEASGERINSVDEKSTIREHVRLSAGTKTPQAPFEPNLKENTQQDTSIDESPSILHLESGNMIFAAPSVETRRLHHSEETQATDEMANSNDEKSTIGEHVRFLAGIKSPQASIEPNLKDGTQQDTIIGEAPSLLLKVRLINCKEEKPETPSALSTYSGEVNIRNSIVVEHNPKRREFDADACNEQISMERTNSPVLLISSNRKGTISKNDPKSTLKSALKSSSGRLKGSTRRRVRGFWNEGDLDSFSNLRETTLQIIFSFLSMQDLCTLSCVCNRFRHLALDPSCWREVDATSFVQAAYDNLDFCPDLSAKKASEALARRLQKYVPEKLTIRCIQERLNPDYYLPSIYGLRELTINDYKKLTDTHLHVMLLSGSNLAAKARVKNCNSIRKLVLENCSSLTNSSVRSIASQCCQIEELSLRGCCRINDVSPLCHLFKISKEISVSTKSSTGRVAELQSLFRMTKSRLSQRRENLATSSGSTGLLAPPQSPTFNVRAERRSNLLTCLFEPPTSAHSLVTEKAQGLSSIFEHSSSPSPEIGATGQSSGLSAIFEPPGGASAMTPANQHKSSLFEHSEASPGLSEMFEPRGASAMTPAKKHNSLLYEQSGAPSLVSSISGGKLVQLDLSFTSMTASALQNAAESIQGRIALDSLLMGGTGESWTDGALALLSSCEFTAFNICCSNRKVGSHRLTDAGFRNLSLKRCKDLTISGQKGLMIGSLISALSSAPKLQCLDVEYCSSLFKGDKLSLTGMIFALHNSTSLEYVNVAGCFADEISAEACPHILAEDEERGRLFLDAICHSASRWTLKELDLRWCWFVTASEVAQVRRACPILNRVHLFGTRCNQLH